MKGTVALVTGGASGLGRAMVRRLASEGAHVIVVDLNEVGAREVANEVGGRALAADVSSPADWERLLRGLDRLDLACLNAGVMTSTGGALEELTDEAYRQAVGVNVDGVVFGVRALAPLLAEDGGGSIVVTASLAGLIGMESDAVYALTKHAVVGFARSIAPQLEKSGVRINCVCPGIADTPLVPEHAKSALKDAGFPLLTVEDVAEAVVVAVRDGGTGKAWAVQPGREPVDFRFANVPGPRVPGSEGVVPPIPS